MNENIKFCCHCDARVNIEDCDTDKYWTNDGDHVLFHICPECGDSVEDIEI